MKRLSVNACLRLLCGLSVLFSVEGEITSTTETSSQAATAAPNTANMLLTSAHKEAETQAATLGRSVTHNLAEVTATAHTSVSHTAVTEEAVASRSNVSTAGLVVVTTAAAAAAASSSGPPTLQTQTLVTTARPTGAAQTPPKTTISETVKPTEDKTQRPSSTTSTDGTSPETTSATTLRLTSTTKPEVTSGLSPSTTSQTSHASPSSSTGTVTAPASEVSDPASSPVTTTKTLPTSSSEGSASPHSPTDGSSSSTSLVSTSPAGILPKRLPIPWTTPTPANTAAPCKVSKVPPSTFDVQHCSTRGTKNHCLIAIAFLAVLACVFMISTVVLCTKLSSRRYKVRKPKEATEMMCISTLLPEEDFIYTRHRTPIANGVLVFPGGRDSDEDGGDNVTLSSFLPENDRYV